MNELIEVPRWFDDIYKEVIRIVEKNLPFIYKPKYGANELLIKVISNQGYENFWTDDLIVEILTPSVALTSMIREKEEEKIEYVSHHKIDLIKAIIDGYKVKEDMYIVVSINDYEDYKVQYGTGAIESITLPFLVKHLYYEDDNHLEKYKELCSKIYVSGFDYDSGRKVKQDFIKTVTGLEPKLIMTKEKAEGLINSYRMIIPIN